MSSAGRVEKPPPRALPSGAPKQGRSHLQAAAVASLAAGQAAVSMKPHVRGYSETGSWPSGRVRNWCVCGRPTRFAGQSSTSSASGGRSAPAAQRDLNRGHGVAERENMGKRAKNSQINRALKRLEFMEGGQPGPKCGVPMQRVRHPGSWRPKPRQPHWFRWRDLCFPCRHLQHYEAAKVLADGFPQNTPRGP